MNNMKCGICQMYKKPDPASFKVGDKVQFLKVKTNSRGMRMEAVAGQIYDESGRDHVIVKHGKNQTQVKRTGLTHQGQPGPITYQMFGVCRCGGAA
jgi:hypothetical protein